MMQPGEWFEVFVGQGKDFVVVFFSAASELSHLKKKKANCFLKKGFK